MSGLDLARLERALDLHASDAEDNGDAFDACTRYCAFDIARRYDDPHLMELTDAEEAAEAATWD